MNEFGYTLDQTTLLGMVDGAVEGRSPLSQQVLDRVADASHLLSCGYLERYSVHQVHSEHDVHRSANMDDPGRIGCHLDHFVGLDEQDWVDLLLLGLK